MDKQKCLCVCMSLNNRQENLLYSEVCKDRFKCKPYQDLLLVLLLFHFFFSPQFANNFKACHKAQYCTFCPVFNKLYSDFNF